MTWQQANIQAAAAYLRERISAGASDARTRAIYEGLLDVLEPARRSTRLQREAATAAKAAIAVTPERDRRARVERRRQNRRMINLGPSQGTERRKTSERRGGTDRRNRG